MTFDLANELTADFRIADLEYPIVLQREQSNMTAELELYIPPKLKYFEGHFTGHPIVPGIAMIDWVTEIGDEIFGCGKAVLAIKQVKFKKIVRPKDILHLRLDWETNRSLLTFKYLSSEGDHASGILEILQI